MTPRSLWIGIAAAFALTACGEREVILPGERLDLRADLSRPVDPTVANPDRIDAVAVNRAAPIGLPPARVNASWTHHAGAPSHAPGHVALGGGSALQWSTGIGAGNSRRARITASPVVQGGQIFTLDSRATVSSLNTAGQVIWSRDVTPARDRREDASGGGLAVSGNTLYVTTAFGQLHALDTATGGTRWVQELDSAATGAPTVVGDLVVVVGRDNRAFGISTANGRIRWEKPGVRSGSGVVGGPSAAIDANRVVLPFSSGQLTAVTTNDGAQIWATTIAGRRVDSTFARILDISGDPVIAGSSVFVGNSSGRTIGVNVGTGERLWTAEVGALGPVTVAGGSLFLISEDNDLLRLDAATGERIWGVELPFRQRVQRLRRLGDVFVHYGPVLAGGRLLVASSDGLMRSFSPVDGRLLSVWSLPAPAASRPVVAGGTLYVVTENGALNAFR